MATEAREGRATQAEIARKLGVSQVTVHRALTGQENVRAETRELILATAQETGYRLNSLASALRRGRFGAIALVQSTEPHRSTFEGHDGILEALQPHDMLLTVSRLPDDKLTSEGFVPRILREWCVDGLLINYTDHIPRPMLDIIRSYRIPSVWVNAKLEADCVYLDDLSAGREATERLLALGHRRVAFADFTYSPAEMADAHYSAADRQAGYEQAMKAAGLAAQAFRPEAHVLRAKREEAARRWLSAEGARPTALLAYSDTTAYPMLLAAATLGIRVPDELSVFTFGHLTMDVLGVRVDAMVAPHGRLGRAAVEMIVQKLDAPSVKLPPRPVPFEYQPGATAGPPAA